MNKPPAFQFYPGDWLSSKATRLMTPAERGGYIELIAHAWPDGIPSSDDELALLSGLGEGWFKGGGAKLRKCFIPHPDKKDVLIHPRLEKELQKQKEWREKSSAGGKKTAKLRKQQGERKVKGGGKGGTKGGTRKAPTKRVHFSLQSLSSVFSLLSSISSSFSKREKVSEENTITYLEAFKVFWEVYPPRNGKKIDKSVAVDKFLKLSEKDMLACILAAKNFADSQAVKDGIGIKDPHRFIVDGKGNEFWKNWVEPEVATKKKGTMARNLEILKGLKL